MSQMRQHVRESEGEYDSRTFEKLGCVGPRQAVQSSNDSIDLNHNLILTIYYS